MSILKPEITRKTLWKTQKKKTPTENEDNTKYRNMIYILGTGFYF